ncbi:MAG TPA: alanine dehydrogenase [Phycisphaerae bacterium]|nr:alanine dehydrogenase [Phycisphaerae bacterium]
MIVGVIKEIKPHEYRVGMIPSGAAAMVQAGHKVLVEKDAGAGSGFLDADYTAAGAQILDRTSDVWAKSDLVIKVKEPQSPEIKSMRRDQILFTYFHFAADRDLTEGVMKSGSVAIAYETVRDKKGTLPLLTPMSEVAGKMSVQEGAKYLERPMMGRGILLGGVPGVEPATVIILGAGVVGTNAAKVAAGLGAHVILMDVSLDRLRYLSDVMPANVTLLFSDPALIAHHLTEADLVIGAVLIPGARCPILIRREHLKTMKPGSVIVDVGVDQGGCCETIRPTTHDNPTYIVDDVVHYGVANMPGAVGRTSTFALTNATLPYALRIANLGYEAACRADPGLAAGVDIHKGVLTNKDVAETFGLEYRPWNL